MFKGTDAQVGSRDKVGYQDNGTPPDVGGVERVKGDLVE